MKAPIDLKADPPAIIWHYTNWKGLEGILDGYLWASHVLFMNDRLEMEQARLAFNRIVRELLPPDIASEWKKGVPKLLKGENQDVYICSFSALKDNLSLWRGYGSPAPGFALGFDFLKLKALAEGEQKCKLVKCVYDRGQQHEVLRRKILSDYKEVVAQEGNEQRTAEISKYVQGKLADALTWVAPEIKNKKFAAEREWRLITRPLSWLEKKMKDRLGFHNSKSLVVPHYRFKFTGDSGSALVHIRIGPNPHMPLLIKSIQMLLGNRGLDNIEVLPTKVPFRNW